MNDPWTQRHRGGGGLWEQGTEQRRAKGKIWDNCSRINKNKIKLNKKKITVPPMGYRNQGG